MSSQRKCVNPGMYTPSTAASRLSWAWHSPHLTASSLGATIWAIGQLETVRRKPIFPENGRFSIFMPAAIAFFMSKLPQ